MKNLWAYYDVDGQFGIDDENDQTIRDIMEACEETGSGSGFGQRDLSFEVEDAQAIGYTLELENAGFKVKIYDMEGNQEYETN